MIAEQKVLGGNGSVLWQTHDDGTNEAAVLIEIDANGVICLSQEGSAIVLTREAFLELFAIERRLRKTHDRERSKK